MQPILAKDRLCLISVVVDLNQTGNAVGLLTLAVSTQVPLSWVHLTTSLIMQSQA